MTYLAPMKPELRRIFARDLPSAHDWFKPPGSLRIKKFIWN